MNTTQAVPTVTPTAIETITINGVAVKLARTETERVKAGQEKVAYWHIPCDQFTVPAADGKTADIGKTATALATALGLAIVLEKLEAKLNQDLRSAQLDNGKDVYSMEQKLGYIRDYINGGFGAARTVKKSPIELAQAEFNTTIGQLKAKLEAKLIDSATYTAQATAAQQSFMATVLSMTAI